MHSGKKTMEKLLLSCIYAGISISSCNMDIMPSQIEYEVGPAKGISICDHLWMSRFILMKIAEKQGLDISFKSKPMQGNWHKSSCFINLSLSSTRGDEGLRNILQHMFKLKSTDERLMKLYGERTAKISETGFSYGIGTKDTSCQIPMNTFKQGKGAFEDRRPLANTDPYISCSSLYSVVALENWGIDDLENHYLSYLEGKSSNS